MGMTAHGFPYPEGGDPLANGDDSIKGLAETIEAMMFAGGGVAPDAPGVWQDATGVVICTDASTAAQPGSTVSKARVMKIGKTVFFQGYGTTGTAAAVCAVTLPVAQMGAPAWRSYSGGLMYITGSTPPANQSGQAIMLAGLDRIVTINWNNAYLTASPSHSVRWGITYEVV